MRSKICLWAILLSLLPIISYAQNENNSQILELYVKSGLQKQIDQLPSLMQALFDQSVPENEEIQKLPKSIISAMRESLQAAFAPERLKEALLAELTGKIEDGDIKKLLEWFNSPTGKKFTQLEEEASTAEAQADMEQYAAHLQDSPPTAQRLKVLQEFDLAVKDTEDAVEMAINMQVAVALGMIATLPSEQQKRPEDVAREVEETRAAVETEVRSQMLVFHLYAYRSMTEAEIQQYTEFAKSPAGSKFNSVATAALKKAVLQGAVKWGQLIGNEIEKMKGNSEA